MNVSSSKVSDLLSCTMAFYLKHVLKLPDRTHWKTLVGSALHNIVEYLLKPKRRAILARILEDGFVMDDHPSIWRYCRMWKDHYKLDLWDMSDMEGMLIVTFSTLKPYIKDGQFKSEQRFEMTIDGAVISGFVDIAAIGERKRILDMKTKGQKFTKAELPGNIQAAIYQMWYYEQYGESVPVDFIMVRHPPTSRAPDKHLQTVAPSTKSQMDGLKAYLVHLHKVMNSFGLDDAYSQYHEDENFCHRVCQLKNPFSYISIKKRDTEELVGNYHLDQVPPLKPDEYAEELRHSGCPRYNS